MKIISIPAGTQMFLGAPAKPMPAEVSNSIGRLVDSIPDIVEAHLPQCLAIGVMDAPAQVLAIIVEPSASTEEVLKRLVTGLEQTLPSLTSIDIWPLGPDSTAVADVRKARCAIGRARTPWWQFWK